MIDRKKLVMRHNPKLTKFEPQSPLSIGNGEFVFTADVTGLQSFNELYEDAMPLCTMANWGWHVAPFSEEVKTLTKADITPHYYETYGRQVPYYTDNKSDKEKYDWIRHNPHKFNLARIGFIFEDEKHGLMSSHVITEINQELDLYTGILHSRFSVNGVPCYVKTTICAENDILVIEAESELIANDRMYVNIALPYPSHEKNGSDWFGDKRHKSQLYHLNDHDDTNELYKKSKIERIIDDTRFSIFLSGEDVRIGHRQTHKYFIKANGTKLKAMIGFDTKGSFFKTPEEMFEHNIKKWEGFWESGGIINLGKSTDARAFELERRIILSQYLTAIQCGGKFPPAETGLSCNSWYGKFHLEMHFWHSAHFALYNRVEVLEKSMQWYIDVLPEAKKAAEKQGYNGARWQKFVGVDGVDNPSPVGPLIVWQQPHPILYCMLIMKNNNCKTRGNREILERYKIIIEETANFMVSFVHFDGESYVIGPPVIPAQERHKAQECINPTFELEYWFYGLTAAAWWFEQLGLVVPEKWVDVINKLALPRINNGVYVAHENSIDTFEKVNIDHPSMLAALGFIETGRIDKSVMNATLDRVLEEWDYPTMWGWDFSVIAMNAVRLGRPEVAIDILLKETEKNVFLKNGHNKQTTRDDLPLYLPGNGALLLAVAMMAAGYEGCEKEKPGFDVEGWEVEFEGINKI